MRVTLCVLAIAACNLDSSLPDVERFSVGGNLRGLWNGADAAVLTLSADGDETVVNVAANGTFAFEDAVTDGVGYQISVTAPAGHQCTVTGGDGTIAAADVTTVEVTCTGPAVTVELSLPVAFTFDPTVTAQPTLPVSLLAQTVSVTVGGDITSASVDDTPVTPGQASAPRPLAVGVTEVTIGVVSGDLSNTFTLACDRGAGALEQSAYVKASNTDAGDKFGTSVSVFGDLVAVGAPSESSSATGINGNQNDDSAPGAGAVYVFRRTGTTWAQEAYIKASNAAAGALFGTSVSLHGDRLAVGAPKQDAGPVRAGAVYVFRRIAGVWTQEQILSAPSPGTDDIFGTAVSLFGDRLAIGASQEDSGSNGVNSTPDETAGNAGAAYVFRRSGTVWSFEAYLKAANSDADDGFGVALSLSGPIAGGDTLAVSAKGEDSNVTGVQNGAGASADNSVTDSGAVYVFKRTNTTWTQQAYIKSPNPGDSDRFSCDLAVSDDTLATSACNEDDGGQGDVGTVYTYVRSGNTWSFEASLQASNKQAGDCFGQSLALSGTLLVVGATFEAGGLPGINPNENDESKPLAGAAYLFRRTAPATWIQEAYMKTLDPSSNDFFANTQGLAISGDTIVGSAAEEDSNATGIDGDALDATALEAGAVYFLR